MSLPVSSACGDHRNVIIVFDTPLGSFTFLCAATKQQTFEHAIKKCDASHQALFEELLSNSDVDIHVDSEWPLVLASAFGNEPAASKLLDAGARAEVRRLEICPVHGSMDRPTAVYAAAVNGHVAILHLLLIRGGRSVINVSIESFAEEERGLADPYACGTPLQASAVKGFRRCVRELLDQEADVNAQGIYSKWTLIGGKPSCVPTKGTALEALVEKLVHPFERSAAFPDGLEIVRMLGRAGANDASIANCRAVLNPHLAANAQLRELDKVLAEKDFAEASLPAGAMKA